jgi:putative ABC transport system substrate-binding protein
MENRAHIRPAPFRLIEAVSARVRAACVRMVAFAILLALVGVAAAADPAPAGVPRHIGVVLVSWSVDSRYALAIRDGLREAGYVEGRDIVIEWRSAHGDYTRVPKLVDELIRRKVDVLVTQGTVATLAAKRATSTIPIVMGTIADPIGSGLVTDLAHPGKNITGNTIMSAELTSKRLELLKESVPQTKRVAVLFNRKSPYSPAVIRQLQAAAAGLSLELKVIGLDSASELNRAFETATRAHVDALYAVEDALFDTHRTEMLDMVAKTRLPVVYWARAWAEDGGFMSYGPEYLGMFRGLAWFVDRILKGTKPGDLPIQQPTRFELVINQSAAQALGITIPQSVLLRADEIVQ